MFTSHFLERMSISIHFSRNGGLSVLSCLTIPSVRATEGAHGQKTQSYEFYEISCFLLTYCICFSQVLTKAQGRDR